MRQSDQTTITMQYGRDGVQLRLPLGPDRVTILRPRPQPALANPRAAFLRAITAPIGTATQPLQTMLGEGSSVAVVIPDHTRPFPARTILTWLFDALPDLDHERVTIIVGTGSHREPTASELERMLGPVLRDRYRVVVHDATGAGPAVVRIGPLDRQEVRLTSAYVDADCRILCGFIEPHFIAGFSGGYKAIMPGLADLASIRYFHNAARVGAPGSTWGQLDGNPTQAFIRACGALAPADFLINVTLNAAHELTGFYCGSVLAAHDDGCAASAAATMISCDRRFPIVFTSNSGAPLDLNLYQTVKGMAAAARIVEPGGLIVTLAECADGVPDEGLFAQLVEQARSPRAFLDRLDPDTTRHDQWQAQTLFQILEQARVALYSTLTPDRARALHLDPITDLDAFVAKEIARVGTDASVAVLPEGPMTIPCKKGEDEGENEAGER